MNDKFFVVPTPIGNLSDITLRALDVLKSVDYIACEDTRVTQKLLNHYNIDAKTFMYHKFNENKTVDKIVGLINQGKSVALVSDAGTPLICDPGSILINKLTQNNIKINSLPGASAITTFLSQISREDELFTFIGFMPRKECQIKSLINEFSNSNILFYESPNRLIKTLNVLKGYNQNFVIAIGRELTKVFEEVVIMNVSNLIEYYSSSPLKGEIIGMIFKCDNHFVEKIPLKEINLLKEQNFSSKDIARIIHTLYKINKNDILKYLNQV